VTGGVDGAALLDALWHQVLSRWDESDAHVAFLRAAQESGRLADAAMRYRGMSGDRERGEVAEAQLAAITALALAGLESARSEVPSRRRIGGIAAVVLGVFFVGVLLLLAQALRR
jgi:hypothetical protein